MSNQISRAIRSYRTSLTRGLSAYLICSGMLLGASFSAVAAEQGKMTLVLPRQIHSAQDFQISVLFSSTPRPHHFFRLEIDIDGNPSALADLSSGNRTEVTLPPVRPGTHILKVVWKNTPDHHPVIIEKPIVVLDGSAAPPEGVSP
ncbi:MAG: hypothetical protein ACYDAM_02460 [Leptospirales bacterium]